jgi:branched-chain amino acid transport system substrate-binding protein
MLLKSISLCGSAAPAAAKLRAFWHLHAVYVTSWSMKSAVYVLVCLLSLAWLRECLGEAKARIGISTALTGNGATYGVDTKNVLQFANNKLAHGKYELIFDDDRCNGKDAVAVAHRFVDVLHLKFVAGYPCSGTVLATSDIFEKAHVIQLSTGASSANVSEAGDYIFRTFPSDRQAAERLYGYVFSQHKKFGVLSEQTDYAQSFWRSFQESAKAGALELSAEDYLTDTSDFRAVIGKLRARNVEGIFINSQTELTFLAILRQIRELQWNPKIYAAYWPGTAAVLDKAADLAEGTIYVDMPTLKEALNEEGAGLYREFESIYGKMNSIELLFGTNFEGFRALQAAIESGQEPRQYLYTHRFQGIFGEWWFDKNGDIRGLDFVLKTIKSGAVRPAS